MTDADLGKKLAAEAAVALVENGMRLGLGTGSTMAFVLDALARRISAENLTVVGVPTSDHTEARARALGIPMTDLARTPNLDLAIDGADEVRSGSLDLIKGLGGALMREKIVVQAASRFIVVADASKVVTRLGKRAPLPVEMIRFACEATARRLEKLGLAPALRMDAAGAPYVTDNGNLIYDCHGIGAISDMQAMEDCLVEIAGVVETGLFLDYAERAIIGGPNGVAVMYPDS